MLVLSRQIHEKIVIDGGIEITILKVKGNTIRLGIDAPKDVRILRGELENRPKAVDCKAARNREPEGNSIIQETG